MDTQRLIQEAKSRFKHKEAKIYLEEKYSNRLNFSSQGGSWTAGPALISFLDCHTGSVILVDNYGNPTKVDSGELLIEAKRVYRTVLEEWYNEYTELQKMR